MTARVSLSIFITTFGDRPESVFHAHLSAAVLLLPAPLVKECLSPPAELRRFDTASSPLFSVDGAGKRGEIRDVQWQRIESGRSSIGFVVDLRVDKSRWVVIR